MAFSKNARVLQASASNAAGATTTGASFDIRPAAGGLATLVVTNGATGPTVACDAILETSRDGTNFYLFSGQTASTASNATPAGTTPFNVEIPPGVMYLRSKFTGNTGQAVTVEAYFQELTSIVG